MTRDQIISDWLSQSPWSTWKRTSVAGDASARRYERLTDAQGASLILMDAPPETCGSQTRFIDIANHLAQLELAAPEILAWDETLGLMILEDLGPTDFARHLRDRPTDERVLYEHAVDVLLVLGSIPAPHGLTVMTPQIGADMTDLAFEWAATDQSADLQGAIKSELHNLLETIDPVPTCLSLRDFHAENLIWRPDAQQNSRVGLLDFQDAFVTHPAYDLASLLRDARRDVSEELVTPLLQRMAKSTDADALKTAFHVMAVQRNLRILGIFHRLAKRDDKTSYLALLPRVIGHLKTDLNTSTCARLAPLIARAFPQLDITL